jgi:hypothetical protein
MKRTSERLQLSSLKHIQTLFKNCILSSQPYEPVNANVILGISRCWFCAQSAEHFNVKADHA